MTHTEYQAKLDEIVVSLIGIDEANDSDLEKKKAQYKAALTKLTEEVVDEVIGKDEPLPEKTFQGDDNIADYFCSECYFAVDTCSHETENDLRSDQRTTKTKLLKGEL